MLLDRGFPWIQGTFLKSFIYCYESIVDLQCANFSSTAEWFVIYIYILYIYILSFPEDWI